MRSTQENGLLQHGMTVFELPESPKEPRSANTAGMEINQSKTPGVGLVVQLLATVYAVVVLVITLRSYTSPQQHAGLTALFIACTGSFCIVFYNALSIEAALKRSLVGHFPILRRFSIVVVAVLMTLPIGARYVLRLDVANTTPPVKPKTNSVAAVSSISMDPKHEAVDPAESHETLAKLAEPILVVNDVRYRSGPGSTVVLIDVDEKVHYEINRLTNPDRIYLDLQGSKLKDAVSRKKFQVTDPILRAIRVAEHEGNVIRVTLETRAFCDYLLTAVGESHNLQIELRNPALGHWK